MSARGLTVVEVEALERALAVVFEAGAGVLDAGRSGRRDARIFASVPALTGAARSPDRHDLQHAGLRRRLPARCCWTRTLTDAECIGLGW